MGLSGDGAPGREQKSEKAREEDDQESQDKEEEYEELVSNENPYKRRNLGQSSGDFLGRGYSGEAKRVEKKVTAANF